MSRSMTVTEAKANFSKAVRAAEQGELVTITRHGKPVVALVGAGEILRWKAVRATGPNAGLVSIAGGWRGSEELADTLACSYRSRQQRSRPRCRGNTEVA